MKQAKEDLKKNEADQEEVTATRESENKNYRSLGDRDQVGQCVGYPKGGQICWES